MYSILKYVVYLFFQHLFRGYHDASALCYVTDKPNPVPPAQNKKYTLM